jgi:predicted HicB family RNase H-like nuclease
MARKLEHPEMSPKTDRVSYSQPSREGKKNLIAWVDEDKHRNLKATAAILGISMNDAVDQAIDTWLAKHAKKR